MSRRRMPDSPNLPKESDFVDYPEDLEQIFAWRHFGGRTIEEAKVRFAERPLQYREELMGVGTKAFVYYFPVIDWWLRCVPEAEEPFDDSDAWIIADGIRHRIDVDGIDSLRPLLPAILEIASYVLANIRRFGPEEDQRGVRNAWTELIERISSNDST
jgi:hypothetical protein